MQRRMLGPIVAACLVLAACNDDNSAPFSPNPITVRNEADSRFNGIRVDGIGTSITSGTCSDGNVASCQLNSYFAQLVRMLNRQPDLPLISEPGCKAPFSTPIITFRRRSGESVALPDAQLFCAQNEPEVDLFRTQNHAVPGALTGQALSTRPEDVTDVYGHNLYSRILPPGFTQVSALLASNPKLIIIELGANDILGIHSGVVIAGASFVPFNVWSQQYNAVLAQVGTVAKQGLLIGLGRDISKLSSLRRGNELWADRAAFLSAFNVDVSANCDGSQNLLVVPAIVPAAVAQGLGRRAAGAPPFVLSCAEGAFNVQDRILTPAEAAAVDAQLVLMSDHIRAQATARGYAFIELEVLYGLAKPTFSVVNFMTTGTPYGPNISLDGLHPSAAGHTIIAQAALRALNDRYELGNGVVFGVSSSPSARNP